MVKACEPDLRLIVQAALFTGCRYGEIGRLIVSDYKPETKSLYIKITKTGKPRHVILTDAGKAFFDKIIKAKDKSTHIFKTRNGGLWDKSLQSRRMRNACQRANIEPAISFHILRHTYASLLAMKGAPMAVIAKQLGHTSTQITEKHYAHISSGYITQVIKEHFPELKIS